MMLPTPTFARRARASRTVSPVIPVHIVAAVNLALSAAVWVALSSALLYSQGRAYRDAYLIAYGADAELLPWDRGVVAYWGMVVGTQGFLSTVLFPIVAIVMWFLLLWMVTEWLSSQRRPGTPSRRVGDPKPIPFVVLGCFGVVGALVLLAVGLLGFQWVQYQAERRGVEDAQREMRDIEQCAQSVFRSVGYRPVHVERAIAGGRETYDGFITTCTDKRCALYDPHQHRTQVVPLDQLVRFDTVPAEQVYLGRP